MTERFASALVAKQRILVCVGAGGVGKTTAATALGLAAAMAGRRAVLLTIDPANRLADALGIPTLGGTATQVSLAGLQPAPGGTLAAMRLDTRATFDGLIARLAPSARAADLIRQNRLYDNIAGSLGASESYMAVERLYELCTEDPPDVIVLDTPPTDHALDFLDAPRRILGVLNSRILAILQNPVAALAGVGSRLPQLVLGTILRALEQFTGLTLVRDVAEFVGAFDGMIDGLRARADGAEQLLRDSGTSFVLITVPNRLAVRRTEVFYRQLQTAGVPCAGLIVNRVLPRALFDREPPAADIVTTPGVPAALAHKLMRTFAELHELAQDEYAAVEDMRASLALGDRLTEIPAFAEEMTSLTDVARFADHLVAGSVDSSEPLVEDNMRPA